MKLSSAETVVPLSIMRPPPTPCGPGIAASQAPPRPPIDKTRWTVKSFTTRSHDLGYPSVQLPGRMTFPRLAWDHPRQALTSHCARIEPDRGRPVPGRMRYPVFARAPRHGRAARAIGSAGERLVHTEEVTGSIPVSPTQV